MNRLSKTRINIGLVRYADEFHPTNELSEQRLRQLEEKIHVEFNGRIPRSSKLTVARLAIENGFQLHFFEKGLGR